MMANTKRMGRGLPTLRLDLVVIMLTAFFMLGVYVPPFLAALRGAPQPAGPPSGLGGTVLLGVGNNHGESLEALDRIRRQVEELRDDLRMVAKENRALSDENEKLRLDNRLQQSNLKSMTKFKNTEIKKLEAKVQELEAKGGDGGKEAGVGAGAEAGGLVTRRELESLRKAKDEVGQKVDQLQQEKGVLMKEITRLNEVLRKSEEATPEPSRAMVPIVPMPMKDEAKGAGSLKLPADYSYSAEPLPVNPEFLPTLKRLFELVCRALLKKSCPRCTARNLPLACGQGTVAPEKLLEELDERDPLGVHMEDPTSFACPAESLRVTLPERRNLQTLAGFQEGKGFVFFQHLRKAGGTGFCDLAQRNMPGQCPPYFCMPDDRGTLVTPPWNTTWLLDNVQKRGWRIAANEWDALPRSKLDIPVWAWVAGPFDLGSLGPLTHVAMV
jgi:hypothetical protein